MATGLLPRGNQAPGQTLSGDIVCNSVSASSFVTTPNLVATNATIGTLSMDDLNINTLTFKPTSAGVIVNNAGGAGASLTLPTTTGALVGTTGAQTLTQKTLTAPILDGLNNDTTPSFLTPIGIDPFNGMVKAWVNYADTGSAQTFQNKTLEAPVITSSLTTTGNINFSSAPTTVGFLSPPQVLVYNQSSGTMGINLNIIDTQTTQTLGNKTLASPSRIAGGNFVTTYFTGSQTIGAVAADVATIPVPTNSNIMILCNVGAKCSAVTSGSNLNKLRSFDIAFAAKNVAGVVTGFIITNNASGDATYVPTFTQVVSGTNVILRATGLANNTIDWAGIYQVINTS